ncbi:hypothetical protein [Promicromonospora sukumoe]|uniref:hypothetical protein n=1 Tax=Promicromonospora sukumoe TaxID=88382 RepID=UPI00365B1C8C
MNDAEAQYIQQNLHVAERLLIILQDRRLLRSRVHEEDFEECRKSAHELRKVLEAELLSMNNRGFLFTALSDMQGACRAFIDAAGSSSQNFRRDPNRFITQLNALRVVFSRQVRLVVERFELPVSWEMRDLLNLTAE